MNGSGVNIVTIDESFTSLDTTVLTFMVPMMTKRGLPGKLNTVTAANYKTRLGYDLGYNPNFLGLGQLLDKVSKVEILRINKDPTYGNVVVFADGTFYQTSGVKDIDVLEAAECFRSVDVDITLEAHTNNLAESVKPGTFKLLLNGVVIAQDDGLGAIAAVSFADLTSGTINYGTGAVALTFAPGATSLPMETVQQYTHDTDAALLVAMESPGDWDTLSIRVSRYFETEESFASSGSVSFVLDKAVDPVSGSYRLEDISGNTLATSGAVADGSAPITGTGITGTINFNTKTVSLTLNPANFPAAGFPMLLKHRYIRYDPFYLFEVLRKTTAGLTTTYQVLESKRVSLTSSLEDFIEEVIFENVQVRVLGPLSVNSFGSPTPVDLTGGTNGSMPSSAELSFAGVDASRFSMICTNGILGASVISEFVKFGESRNKMVLWDIPNVQTYIAAKLYRDSVFASPFQMGYWVSDFRTVGNKKYAVYPSVKAALAYAKMFRETGTLNHPPAGYRYAAVDAEELLETDAALYPAELKLARINYIAQRSSGPVIWEHRTGYGLESDMSYGSTVMTHIALSTRMKNFTDNFPFQFVTSDLLTLIDTGLKAIAAEYLQKNFVWKCDVIVPTFASVKASGARAMNIDVDVKYAEDGQEFTLRFHLKATA